MAEAPYDRDQLRADITGVARVMAGSGGGPDVIAAALADTVLSTFDVQAIGRLADALAREQAAQGGPEFPGQGR